MAMPAPPQVDDTPDDVAMAPASPEDMAKLNSDLTDPRFKSLPVTERQKFLLARHPNTYAALPPDQQRAFFMQKATDHTSAADAAGQDITALVTGVPRTLETVGRAVGYRYNPDDPKNQQAVHDTASMAYHMVADPTHELFEGKRPDESAMTEPSPWYMRPVNATATVLGANMPEARQAKERGDAGAQIAHTLTVPLLTAGLGRLMRGPKDMTVAPTRREVSALQSLAPRAVTGLGPADAAARTAEIQSILKQVAAEQGITDATIRRDLAQAEHAPATDLVGDVGRGNQRVFDLVKGAVDFAHRPLDAVMRRFGKQPAAGTPMMVSQDLYAKAAEVGKVNPPLSKALRALADKARAASTFGELNDIKVHANKMADDLYSPIPGKQINASAEAAYAYRAAADAIRQRMYPALQQASGGTLDLSALGRREADAIALRDGVMEHYYSQVAPAQANMGAANFLEYTLAGEGAPGHSYYTRHMAGRGLEKAGVIPGGGGKMNKTMRRGIGKIGEGMTPEAVVEGQPPAAATTNGIPPPPGGESAIDEATRGGPGTPPPTAPDTSQTFSRGGRMGTQQGIADQVNAAKAGQSANATARVDAHKVAKAAIMEGGEPPTATTATNPIAAASSVNSPADVARLQEAASQRLFGKGFSSLTDTDKFIALREATKMQAAEQAGAPHATPSTPKNQVTVTVEDQPRNVTLSDSQMNEWNAAKQNYENEVAFHKRNNLIQNDPQELAAKLKGAGMRYAAEKRRISGELTGVEKRNAALREASNYKGKLVSVGGKEGTVVGTSFGKIRIKLDSTGDIISAAPEDIRASGGKIDLNAPKSERVIPPDTTATAGQGIPQPPSISIRKYKPGRTPRGVLVRNRGGVAAAGTAGAVSAGIPPPPSPVVVPPPVDQ
jgi:hypothetical protein